MFARVNKKEVLLFLKPVDPVCVKRQNGEKLQRNEMYWNNSSYHGKPECAGCWRFDGAGPDGLHMSLE